MAKRTSKKSTATAKTATPAAKPIFKHKSFKRSYREDYERKEGAPGLWQHAATTFKLLASRPRLFGGLFLITVLLFVLFVGLMNEKTYVQFQEFLDATHGGLGNVAKSALILTSALTTGGFAGTLSESGVIFTVTIFLITFLITIYLIRHLLAGDRPKLRDGLFNALTPLLSTLVIAGVILLSLVPVGIFAVVLSAAITTNLLTTPLYTLVFIIFSGLLILLSLYLLSGSLIALVAVSAPGIYPIVALHTTSDLIAGRRMRFCVRFLFGLLLIALAWVIIMVPLILLDIALKSALPWLAGFPFIPICLLFMTSASFIYFTAYLYLYYRELLQND